MDNRLKEIKNRYDYNNSNGDFFYEAIVHSEKIQLVKDVAWLIAEVKRSEQLIDSWRATCVTEQTIGMEWKDRAKKAEAENKELQAVFDLQETRTKKAEHLWQRATGKHDTWPDLGVLLDWLMSEIKRLKKMQPIANVTLSDDAKYFERVAGKQRRHRKWALKELYMWRAVYKEGEEDCKYHYKQAEKRKAERLSSLLSHHGISF